MKLRIVCQSAIGFDMFRDNALVIPRIGETIILRDVNRDSQSNNEKITKVVGVTYDYDGGFNYDGTQDDIVTVYTK